MDKLELHRRTLLRAGIGSVSAVAIPGLAACGAAAPLAAPATPGGTVATAGLLGEFGKVLGLTIVADITVELMDRGLEELIERAEQKLGNTVMESGVTPETGTEGSGYGLRGQSKTTEIEYSFLFASDRSRSVIQLLPRAVDALRAVGKDLETGSQELAPMSRRKMKNWLWPSGPPQFAGPDNSHVTFRTPAGRVSIRRHGPAPGAAFETVQVFGLGRWRFTLSDDESRILDSPARRTLLNTPR